MNARFAILATASFLMPLSASAIPLEFPQNATRTVSITEANSTAKLPIGPYLNGRVEMQTAEGNLRTEAWKVSQNSISTYQLIKPLRDQLTGAGFEIVYDCKDSDCGGFDFRYEIDLLPEPEMHVDLGDFRFLTAKRLSEDGAPELISLIVSRSTNSGFIQYSYVGENLELDPSPVNSTKSETQLFPKFELQKIGSMLETTGRAPLEDLTFSTGSSALARDTFSSLEELANYLNSNPKKTVALVGHTDSEGSLAGNIALSRKRALSVVDRLVTQYGVSRSQVEADGVGYLSPRASNLTDEGRTQNRRVEVILTSTQ